MDYATLLSKLNARAVEMGMGCRMRAEDTLEAAVVTEIVRLRAALDKLSRLGNEPMHGNSDGNLIAYYALYPETDPSVCATNSEVKK